LVAIKQRLRGQLRSYKGRAFTETDSSCGKWKVKRLRLH
jgi:hypothetical protein